MGAINDLLDGGSQVTLLEDLARASVDTEPLIRDRLAQEQATLGSPSRIGSFDQLLAPGTGNPIAGASPFDVATVIAADSITANELTVGGIGGYNRIVNPSFESDLVGWSVSAGVSIVSGGAYDGAKSLGFAAGAYKFATQGTTQGGIGPLKNGHTYTCSFYIASSAGATSSAGAGVVGEGIVPVTGGTNLKLVTALSTTWTRYSFTFVASGDQATPYIVLTNSYGGTSTGTIYIDAVQFEEGGILTAFGLGGTDVRNATGHVVIDSTGIQVINGEISIQDQSGTEVMSAAGFSGPWDDFMHSGGIYNNTFAAGTLGAVVNSPASVPYWSFARVGNAASSSVSLEVAGEAASNRRINLQLINSNKAVDDRIRIQQVVPIVNNFPRTTERPFTASFWGDLVADSGTTLGAVEISVTNIALDGSTVIGSPTIGSFWASSAGAIGKVVGSVTFALHPLAGFVFVEVGLRRPAVTLNSATFLLYGVSVTAADPSRDQGIGGSVVLTTSLQNILQSGVPVKPGRYIMIGVVDFNCTAAGTGTCTADLVGDGGGPTFYGTTATGMVAPQILMAMKTAGVRATVSQTWLVDVPTGQIGATVAGVEIFDLKVRKTVNDGTATATNHSQLIVIPWPFGVGT